MRDRTCLRLLIAGLILAGLIAALALSSGCGQGGTAGGIVGTLSPPSSIASKAKSKPHKDAGCR